MSLAGRWLGALFRLGPLFRLGTGPARPPIPVPDINWLYPWVSLDNPDHCALFEAELRAEIGPRHTLRGRRARAIGRIDGMDDILYMLDGGEVAQVHLTFASRMERDPRWPRAGIFPTVGDWIERSMRPTHEEWSVDARSDPG